MFKYFRQPTHREYATDSLEKAKMELLLGLEKLEYYEGWVACKRKQIERLEQTTKEYQNEQINTQRSSGMLSAFSRVKESRNAEPTLSAV